MAFKKLPRSGGQQNVVLSGALWDRLCDMVEQSLNLSVSHPLQMLRSQAGTTLSLQDDRIAVCKTKATQSGKSARLDGRSVTLTSNAAGATGNLTVANIGTEATTDDVTFWDMDGAQCYRVGVMIGKDANHKPVILGFPRGFFAVKVTQNGGSNGNATTAASWTYDVKDLAGNTISTSPIGQEKPRGNGTRTAGSSYGVAFYDGSTLKLWDAGESDPTVEGCT